MKRTVRAIPTKPGNGFTEGKVYVFRHVRNGAYETTNDNGHRRVESYPFGSRSAHLWNGVGDWLFIAGRFEEVTE